MPKHLDESAAELLSEYRRRQSCERGSRVNGWAMDFWILRGTLRARFFVEGSLITGLDHHAIGGGDIQEGYHWDLYPPLRPTKVREHLDPQPADIDAALELVFSSWHISLRMDKQLRMR